VIKLTSEELKYISLLESRTGCAVKDCIINGNDITFVVKEGDLGLAVGKKGAVVNRIKEELKKEIHIYEHSDDIARFIANLFYPIKVEKVETADNEARVYINPAERKRAIGKAGKKIKNVKELVGRHFGIENIIVV
jgi:N utilization substance protein A